MGLQNFIQSNNLGESDEGEVIQLKNHMASSKELPIVQEVQVVLEDT